MLRLDRFHFVRVELIIASGLHEASTRLIDRTALLGQQIAKGIVLISDSSHRDLAIGFGYTSPVPRAGFLQ